MRQVRVNVTAPMETRRAFIAHCHAQQFGVSSGIKLAVEWHQAVLGNPMPYDPADFTTTRGGQSRMALLVSWPEEWRERAQGDAAVREMCLAALAAWEDAGRPELKRGPRRKPEWRCRRAREKAERRLAFANRAIRGCIKISLWRNAVLVADLAHSRGINIGAAVRQAMQWAYRRDSGKDLGEKWLYGFKAASISNDRPELANRTLYYPGEWQEALDEEAGGQLSLWIREAVFDWLDAQGVPAHRPQVRDAIVPKEVKEPKPVTVKPAKLRAAGPCERTKQLASEARNESRWPAGCGLRIGSITGRPYVGKVARDERAEGVAA